MSKVAVVGAGAVGTAIAYAAQIRGVCRRLALYDVDAAKVRAEVLDLNHGLQFTPMAQIVGGDDLEVCAGSDVVVITAGAKQKPGQTRLDLAAANVEMCRGLVPRLVAIAPDALLLVVTNPVDVVTFAAQQFSGWPSHRVFGSGTVLDSSRLRFLIAEHTGVAVQNVHAYIAGEHGDSEVPLWSTASIGGVPVQDWSHTGDTPLDAAARAAIHERVVRAAYEIIAGKGATSLAIGLAVARILEAVLHDEHRVLPVSSRLDDVHGVSGVCLSMPSVVGRQGVERVLPTPLSAEERTQLLVSAEAVRSAAQSLGLSDH
ncbi:L-lactate dehydrogenase [Nocardioides sp. HDW12B]|uniref:L-lactate dehydrogenase n=1 Tax=Nocardioides sp. HDW12B TaxID=2714939 RepID=UPI00140A11AA|nr:L-lactate dehydrogenase [Nocardioides sp. HDW12B]QIK67758.1 L-lactate dehydrogenase [Nocardioides sp. HDW12B]